MADTVYEVRLEYTAATASAAAAVDGLGFKMIKINQALELFRKGWDLAATIINPMIDVNSSLDQARIRIAGIANATEGWTGGLTGALSEANTLIKNFTKDAAASVATTRDFVDIGSRLAPALLPAGKTLEDVRDITKAIVVGTTALGLDMKIAGDQISRMVQGMAGLEQITFKTLFSGEFQKFGTDFTKMFNQMTTAERLDLIMQKLEKFKEVGALVEGSWKGVTSTLEDMMELALADIGKPLFEEITKELQSWVKWINANDDAIKEFARTAGTALVDGFKFMRDTFTFIVDNKEAIMAVAAALAASVGVGKLMGGIGGAAGVAGTGGAAAAKAAMAKAAFAQTPEGKIQKFASSLQLATVAAIAFYTILELGARDIDAAHKREIEGIDKAEELRSRIDDFGGGTTSAAATLSTLEGMGMDTATLKMLSSTKLRSDILDFTDDVFASKEKFDALPPAIRDIVKGMRDSGMSTLGIDNMLKNVANALAMAELDVKFRETGKMAAEWNIVLANAAGDAKEAAADAARLTGLGFVGKEAVGEKLKELREKARKIDLDRGIEKVALKGLTPKERRLLGKGPKMTINVVINNDFKANANPEKIKVATISALEKVARNRVMARTAPPIG